jgi:hypothetical protein
MCANSKLCQVQHLSPPWCRFSCLMWRMRCVGCDTGRLPSFSGSMAGGDPCEPGDPITVISAFKVHQGGSDMSHGNEADDRCVQLAPQQRAHSGTGRIQSKRTYVTQVVVLQRLNSDGDDFNTFETMQRCTRAGPFVRYRNRPRVSELHTRGCCCPG